MKLRGKLLIAVPVLGLMAGCHAHHGHGPYGYHHDPVGRAVVGGAIGAGLGVATAAIVGGRLGAGAAIGGILGAASGLFSGPYHHHHRHGYRRRHYDYYD